MEKIEEGNRFIIRNAKELMTESQWEMYRQMKKEREEWEIKNFGYIRPKPDASLCTKTNVHAKQPKGWKGKLIMSYGEDIGNSGGFHVATRLPPKYVKALVAVIQPFDIDGNTDLVLSAALNAVYKQNCFQDRIGELKLLKVQDCMIQYWMTCDVLFVTFDAIHVPQGDVLTCQARVMLGSMSVLAFRLKPSDEQEEQKWLWKDDPPEVCFGPNKPRSSGTSLNKWKLDEETENVELRDIGVYINRHACCTYFNKVKLYEGTEKFTVRRAKEWTKEVDWELYWKIQKENEDLDVSLFTYTNFARHKGWKADLWKPYGQEVFKSGGFHVTTRLPPHSINELIAVIQPFDTDGNMDLVLSAGLIAVHKQNCFQDRIGELKLLKVQDCTIQYWMTYDILFVTFETIHVPGGDVLTCQAKVILGSMFVLAFRLKPSDGQVQGRQKWLWKDNPSEVVLNKLGSSGTSLIKWKLDDETEDVGFRDIGVYINRLECCAYFNNKKFYEEIGKFTAERAPFCCLAAGHPYCLGPSHPGSACNPNQQIIGKFEWLKKLGR